MIISGGNEAVPGIRRAKDMGLHVVVSDMNPKAPGFAIADDKIIASTYDVEATLSAAKDYHKKVRPIDGVICIASDVPLTVASVAAELGLPGIPVEAARLASDKILMKNRFQEKGIAIPWFSEVFSYKHLKEIVSQRGFPLVIKPVDSRGARGVLRLTASIDLQWAYHHALSGSPSKRVMVEEYLDGQQISTEAIILRGVGVTPGFTERNYEYLDRFEPFIIENGGHQPTSLPMHVQESVSELAIEAGRALGVETGIIKGDMVYTDAGPKVIEVATRLSGGWFSTDQIPLATGVDLIGAAIRIALGEYVPLDEVRPKHWRGVAIRYFFPEPGRITAIKNTEKFNDVSWVHKLIFFVKPGDIVEEVTNHTKRAGCVITTGETRDEAIARAEEVIRTVHIETIPSRH
ncbi:MAG TPA: ATP-grasp domain-containing protein [Syntrophales bacterium]|nr:ATP-grasp domain-containing protein [Syntrophales bacterium]